jgi:iron complex outermembrane receptor protein
MHRTSKLLLSAAVGAIGCATAPAWAQSATDNDTGTGNEIVVTAQKRNEALQDVPIAISPNRACRASWIWPR